MTADSFISSRSRSDPYSSNGIESRRPQSSKYIISDSVKQHRLGLPSVEDHLQGRTIVKTPNEVKLETLFALQDLAEGAQLISTQLTTMNQFLRSESNYKTPPSRVSVFSRSNDATFQSGSSIDAPVNGGSAEETEDGIQSLMPSALVCWRTNPAPKTKC